MWFPLLTRNKAKDHCSVCKKELTRFRYRPLKEWNIEGVLCGDCHVIKSMEYSGSTRSTVDKKRQDIIEDDKELISKCGICNARTGPDSESLKPKWQWNVDTNLVLCKRCYSSKSKEYERRINYCAACGNKMSFFRYNPKPKWKIDGQLCRKCWDDSNKYWKNQG